VSYSDRSTDSPYQQKTARPFKSKAKGRDSAPWKTIAPDRHQTPTGFYKRAMPQQLVRIIDAGPSSDEATL